VNYDCDEGCNVATLRFALLSYHSLMQKSIPNFSQYPSPNLERSPPFYLVTLMFACGAIVVQIAIECRQAHQPGIVGLGLSTDAKKANSS
jgi:hypothetical protein